MAPQTVVRSAKPSDAATVRDFIRALAAYEGHSDVVEVSSQTLEQQMKSADPPFECLLAERDGKVVGFALFYRNYKTWTGVEGLYLEDLYVAEECRGEGVGRALLRALAQVAVRRRYRRIDWVVTDSNQRGVDFYRSLGGAPLTQQTPWRLCDEPLSRLAQE